MKDYTTPIRMFVCLAGLLLLVSCDAPANALAQPQVVRKKFVVQADRSEPQPQTLASAPAGPAPPAGGPQHAVAQVKPKEAPSPGPGPAPPDPKPKAPPPPTQTVETVPSAPPRAVGASTPTQVAKKTESAPASPAKMPGPETQKPGEDIESEATQITALLNIQTPPPYSPNGKVDPFEPLLRDDSAQASAAKLRPKKRDPQSPLEKIDLGQLKLVAIICASTGNRALVEEASGKGYILREGTYIGMNSGKVVDIAIDKVLIEEEFVDIYGKTIMQKKEITLPKPPGEL